MAQRFSGLGPFFKGRIGRSDYWKLVLGILGIRYVVFFVVIYFFPQYESKLGALDFLMVFLAGVVGGRFRDFGWSAAWGWLFVAMVAVVIPILEVIVASRPIAGGSVLDAFPDWATWLNPLLLWVPLILIGAKLGDAGPNRFGEPGRPFFQRFEEASE